MKAILWILVAVYVVGGVLPTALALSSKPNPSRSTPTVPSRGPVAPTRLPRVLDADPCPTATPTPGGNFPRKPRSSSPAPGR
jgi:hypothetical protein